MPIIELKIPGLGETITSVTFSKWLMPNGSIVKLDDLLCELETEKANQEIPADTSGRLTHIAKEGEDLNIGAIYGKIDTDAAIAQAAAPAVPLSTAVPTSSTPEPAKTGSYAEGLPSPAAAKILSEVSIQTSDVNGTGRDGRITKEDAQKAVVQKYAPAAVVPPTPEPVAPPATKPPPPTAVVAAAPLVPFSRRERREKMTRMRRTIAKRLVSAKNNTAMLTTFNEVDMTAVMELREKYQEAFVKKYGIKLGFMSLFAKACAKVLLEMPDVNARIDGEDIIYQDFVDISLAISTPTGLVVPPIRNVESIKMSDFELKLKELAAKARDGKLTMEEMTGGTFTITNGGVFGSLMSTPIINEPQSAILGMHAIKDRAMVINGEIKIRPMMYLALSYDHRVIDGSTSVTFLVKVKTLLEDPMLLMMDL